MAWSQTERGTIVVVIGFRDGPVAVAADSLAYTGNGDTRNICKITTIGDKLIISATGYTGHESNGKWDFSALANAHEEFNRFQRQQIATKNFASKFVDSWKQSLVDKLNQELKVRPDEVTTDSVSDDLMSAIVVGLDENGLISTWIIRMKYKKIGTGGIVALSMPVERKFELPYYVAAGKNEIAREAYAATTIRGKKWNHELWEGSAGLPVNQRSTYWTRRLVDLTITNHPSEIIGFHQLKTVGGPIDSLTIDHTGRIRWGEHKPDCQ
jgi:hypothetical protein